jgi:hypothetical protein
MHLQDWRSHGAKMNVEKRQAKERAQEEQEEREKDCMPA